MNCQIEDATPADVPSILTLIKELAIYERAGDEVTLTGERFLQDGFGPDKITHCFIARADGKIRGIALIYTKYSSWKGRCIFLEDIIVNEKYRGKGIGSALFRKVIEHAKRVNAGRLEWQVLDWNESAIDFYRKFGAEFDPAWINCRFTNEQLQTIDINTAL